MSSGLNFQDFGLVGESDQFDSPFTNNSVNLNNDRRNTEKDTANLVDGSEAETTGGNKHSFLSFKFYQQYFDVDTEQVQSRILNSALPKKGCNFIRDHVQPSADLYGPFWICVTLVFVAAIFGNFSHYIDSLGDNPQTNDFKLVTGMATIVGSYVLLVPLAIYILLYYRNSNIQYSFIELVSLYGYSLSIFIPASVLFIFHYQWFRWAVIIACVLMSGFVLASTIWDSVKSEKNKLVAFGVIFGVLFLHTALAVGVKEYYFDTILPSKQGQVTEAPMIKSTAAALVLEPQQADKKPVADAQLAADLPEAAKSEPKKEEKAKKETEQKQNKQPEEKSNIKPLVDPMPNNNVDKNGTSQQTKKPDTKS